MEFNPAQHMFGNKDPPLIAHNPVRREIYPETTKKKDGVERKVIAPDIFLDKELDMHLAGGENPRYLFKLVSKSLRVISFEVDFTGSQNVEYYQDSDEPVQGQLKFSRTVSPPKPPQGRPHLKW
jgi:hypothetical protein